ncbi:MAG TPA: hypothetical protein VFR15_07925 [Chloroflexia bacterium]|nr:hypothetical protein [Chloroflexia bacterium]
MKQRLIALAALAAVLLAVGCGAPAATPTPPVPAATATTEAAPTATTAPVPTATNEPTAEATATTKAESTPTPSDAGEPGEPGIDASVSTRNPFETIFAQAEAPEGWSVRPCEGNGPLLCMFDGSEHMGTIELFASHIETLPEFAGMLRDAGLEPGSIDYRDPAQAAQIREAFDAFIESNLETFEEDRQIRYRGSATFTRLPIEDIRIGDMPGVRYGFNVADESGKVVEKWPSHAAFDGNVLYILVPHYDEDSFFSFKSLEALEEFEPFVPALLEGLTLPLPVEQTEVKSVTTLARVPLFRFYGAGSNPVTEVPAGQTLTVTGRAPGEGPWRVECPDGDPYECWVSADPRLTQPGE